MNSIETLLEKHTVVWFSVGSDEETKVRFLKEIITLGIPWVSGADVTEDDSCSHFMGIGRTRKLGHVSWQIWRASWLSEEANPDHMERLYHSGHVPVRVDYGRFSRGETDYLVHENIVNDVSGFVLPISGTVIHIE